MDGGSLLDPVAPQRLVIIIQLLAVEDEDLLVRVHVRHPVQLHLEVLHCGVVLDLDGNLLAHHGLHHDLHGFPSPGLLLVSLGL